MSLSHDIAIVVAWVPSNCLEINNWNAHSNKVNYWWKPLGRWHCESRNSSPWRCTFKKSRDENKKHTRLVFCSTRTPSEITKAETLRPSDSGFLLGDLVGGSGWTEYSSVFFIIITHVLHIWFQCLVWLGSGAGGRKETSLLIVSVRCGNLCVNSLKRQEYSSDFYL